MCCSRPTGASWPLQALTRLSSSGTGGRAGELLGVHCETGFLGALRIHSPLYNRFLMNLRGHVGPVFRMAWAGDSRMLISASEDSTMKLWDVKTGKMVEELPGHAGSVYAVDWSPTGTLVASGGADKTLKLCVLWAAYARVVLSLGGGGKAVCFAAVLTSQSQYVSNQQSPQVAKLSDDAAKQRWLWLCESSLVQKQWMNHFHVGCDRTRVKYEELQHCGDNTTSGQVHHWRTVG